MGAKTVGVAVIDARTDLPLMINRSRYIGRVRSLYGIPQPQPGLRPLAEQLASQIETGLRKNGAEVTTLVPESKGSLASEIAEADVKGSILVVEVNDAWIDFANPVVGRESILYFDATAEVWDRQRRKVATANRKTERDFQLDPNDSISNVAIREFQQELQELVNRPSIRAALAR